MPPTEEPVDVALPEAVILNEFVLIKVIVNSVPAAQDTPLKLAAPNIILFPSTMPCAADVTVTVGEPLVTLNALLRLPDEITGVTSYSTPPLSIYRCVCVPTAMRALPSLSLHCTRPRQEPEN